MKTLKISLISLFFVVIAANSQSLSVFDVDTTNFPRMSAKFYALDKDGNQIKDLDKTDFEITENDEQRQVISVSCPGPEPTKLISAVLTMDVSGSMAGYRLFIAKEAANAWIDALPYGKSNCCITGFSTTNMFLQDFTNDKNRLKKSLNSMYANGGTDYDVGLINPMAGGILAAKTGKYKRVIVFLTDGMPNSYPDSKRIIAAANAEDITIFCVTLGLACPSSLREIAEKTQGEWFENVTTVEQARNVYKEILNSTINKEPCEITWESARSCNINTNLYRFKCLRNGKSDSDYYLLPLSSVTELEFTPNIVKFHYAEPGIKRDTTISIKAINSDFNVTNITSSNASFFVTPTSFSIKAGETRNLTLSFIPADKGYTQTKLTVENDVCTEKFYARGGWPGYRPTIKTIKLIIPNGNETLFVGSDTMITWEGVLPNEFVKLEYSIDNGKNWIAIEEKINGLDYKWRVPNTPSNECLARVTSKALLSELENEMILIPSASFMMGKEDGEYALPHESPKHLVDLTKDFLISQYEITQKQYEEIMGFNPSKFVGIELPVDNVSWLDAIEFCNKLSEVNGYQPCYKLVDTIYECDWEANGYRLPTEAEWEYACKANSETDYYNGDIIFEDCHKLDENLDKIAWYCYNSDDMPHTVGSKEPNEFGLYDMLGNVSEWCWDSYLYDYYANSSVVDPRGPEKYIYRCVRRGGSWYSGPRDCRTTDRESSEIDATSNIIGFRVVRVE
jgi:formylglycine-generating enzyme required for sulfatase activity/uncharacterized protein YegL